MTAVQPAPLTLSATAASFIGVRFQLHGRDPATGLDCVGLCLEALSQCGCKVALPTRYGLRNSAVDHMLSAVSEQACLAPCSGPVGADEIILVRLDPIHFHLLISASGTRFIHAHASLRRIVCLRGKPPGSIIARWRINNTNSLHAGDI